MLSSVRIQTHTFWHDCVVQWINTYSTRSNIIWSCIFLPCNLVRHFPGLAFSVASPASAVIIFPVGLNAGDWKLAVFVRLLGIYRWSSISWCGRSLPRQTSGNTSLCLDVPRSASQLSLALSVLAAWSHVSTGTTDYLLDRPEFLRLQIEVCFLLTWQIKLKK